VPADSATQLMCLRNLLANNTERIYFKDRESRFMMVSTGWLESYGRGRPLADIIGRTDFDVFSSEHAAQAYADEQRMMVTGEPVLRQLERETFVGRPDEWVSTTKLPLRDAEGEIVGTYGITRIVTEQIQAQEALVDQGSHDALTGLPNRRALIDRLREALYDVGRDCAQVAVVFVDLDGFQETNDLHGQEVGDRVLLAVARRLARAARARDTVARFGSDEFVVLCPGLDVGRDLRTVSDRLRRAVHGLVLDELAVPITVSVGASATDDAGYDAEKLLACAEVAMRAARRSGGGRFEVYDAALHDVDRGSAALVAQLRTAIAGDELFVLYQPIVSLADGALSGVEALVRWRHPERGVLTPDLFIPLAEQHGLVAHIDAFVLRTACAQLAAWEEADPTWRSRQVAVNLSGRGLHDPRLCGVVIDTLRATGLDPERLCLEITETALIGELDGARKAVDALADHGVRVALDDFGTGYSTLAHLQRLRANVIKIDRSFVEHIARDDRDREIVAAVTAMAHALGMTVVGEGVETPVERELLRAVGCDEAQGFLFARPIDAEHVAEYAVGGGAIAAWRGEPARNP
jgi:diguanylate cyclase (GGDEF)-like protein/PAS domain S-box-containing protein